MTTFSTKKSPKFIRLSQPTIASLAGPAASPLIRPQGSLSPRPVACATRQPGHPGGTRGVYVDYGLISMAHARALMRGNPAGSPRSSARTCGSRSGSSATRLMRTLDLDEPVALMLVAVLHFLMEEDQGCGPRPLARTRAARASGPRREPRRHRRRSCGQAHGLVLPGSSVQRRALHAAGRISRSPARVLHSFSMQMLPVK
jgi:hypothetical protein